jgi:hypothetical protein
MGIAALAADDMISGFPNPVLPLVTAESSFEDIMMMQKLINVNCISIPSLTGGRHHGRLGLIVTVQECTAISAIPFGVYVNPGPIAQVAVGTEAVAADSIVRVYSEVKRIHTTRLNCDEACKKLILASYANMYTEALEDYLLGYANVNPLNLLVYLRLMYGRIGPTQLADCYNKMTTPYDIQDPIEALFS